MARGGLRRNVALSVLLFSGSQARNNEWMNRWRRNSNANSSQESVWDEDIRGKKIHTHTRSTIDLEKYINRIIYKTQTFDPRVDRLGSLQISTGNESVGRKINLSFHLRRRTSTATRFDAVKTLRNSTPGRRQDRFCSFSSHKVHRSLHSRCTHTKSDLTLNDPDAPSSEYDTVSRFKRPQSRHSSFLVVFKVASARKRFQN